MKMNLTAFLAALAFCGNSGYIEAQQTTAAQQPMVAYQPATVQYVTASAPPCQELSCMPVACCDDGGGQWLADAELTFLRFHAAHGFIDDDIFDFELAPRVSAAYLGAEGFGARVRWWGYDEEAVDNGLAVTVDTHNLDAEVFTGFEFNCRVVVEISGGLRMNEFEYTALGGEPISDFDGYGGVFGIKAAYVMGNCSDIYLRARWAFLMGDDEASTTQGDRPNDVVRDQGEIGVGFEHAWCLDNGAIMTARVGAEFQSWGGYTQVAREAVGFGGFLVGLGLNY